MLAYLVRRLLYVVPILFGVMVLTFALFFVMQSPESMARNVLGKRANPQNVQQWLEKRGYDKPLFFNTQPEGQLFDSIFWNQMRRFATLDLGKSDTTEREISQVFREGAGPSLLITLPAFLIGLGLAVMLSLYLVFLRDSPIDTAGVVFCVALMSIPAMVYIIFGQGVVALSLNWFPAFGFHAEGLATLRFILLPVLLMVIIHLGRDVRLYRAVFLEEIAQDYVRTARAKGVSNSRLLRTHVLKNGLISLITLTVSQLPQLILGSLLLENFFGIPGLGNALFHAIQTNDFATVGAFVFLGALLIQAGYIATDLCYGLVDPRIRLGSSAETTAGPAHGTAWGKWAALLAGGALLVWALGSGFQSAWWKGTWTALSTKGGQLLAGVWVQNALVVGGFALVAGLILAGARNERWQRAFSRLRRDRIGVTAGIVIALYLLIGALDMLRLPIGPGTSGTTVLDWLARGIPAEKSYSAPLATHTLSVVNPEPLRGRHLLGTTALGKDTLLEVLKACRTALLIGGLTSAIYLPIGALLGIMAGYFRRWTDDLIQYVYSLVSSIPDILLLVSVLLVLGKSLTNMSITLALTSWVGLCRLLRGETLRQSERPYVAAARALGQSHWKIITRHLLPNVMHLVLINFVLGFSSLVLAEAILSYLGVGAPVGTASWGAMIDSARNELSREPQIWWNIAAATGALFFLVLSLNLFGDALRRAFDPKRG